MQFAPGSGLLLFEIEQLDAKSAQAWHRACPELAEWALLPVTVLSNVAAE
jgi:hypothetical protein